MDPTAKLLSARAMTVERWVATLIGVYAVTAISLDWRLYLLDFMQYAPIFLFAAPVISFAYLVIAGIWSRPRAPLTFVRQELSTRWRTAVCITFVGWAGMSAFWTYKFHIPEIA